MKYCHRKDFIREYEILSFNFKERFFKLEDGIPYGAFAVNQQSGNIAVRTSNNDIIEIRNEKGEILKTLNVPYAFIIDDYMHDSMKYSHNGRFLAVGGTSHVLLFDAENGEALHLLEGTLCFLYIAFSPDDRMIAGLGEGKYGMWHLWIWDTKTGKVISSIEKEKPKKQLSFLDFFATHGINGVDFLPNGKQVLIVLSDELIIYDISQERFIKSIKIKYEISTFKFASKSDTLYLFTENGIIPINTKTWHKGRSTEIYLNKIPISDEPFFILSPDETMLAGAYENTFGLWSLPDLKIIKEIPGYDPIWGLAFSKDNSMIYIICANTVHVTAIQKDLEFPGFTDKDSDALPYINRFLSSCKDPDDQQIEAFLCELKNRGLGYINENTIRSDIKNKNKGFKSAIKNLFRK